MYEIYDTKGYVLRSLISRESDARVLLFTEKFGLIWANASGAKKDISKFRNLTQDLTKLNVFLVKGKGGYRITGGQFIDNIYFSLKKNTEYSDEVFKEKIIIIKNIFLLLEKVFLHNEQDFRIFSLLEIFLDSFKKLEHTEVLKEKEVLFLAKLFFLWGYFDQNDLIEKIGQESLKLKFSKKEIDNLREKINQNISKVAF